MSSSKSLTHLFTLLLAGSLALNHLFPLMIDEAYYLEWARRSTWPDFGFFDHPPFVSWQAGVFNWVQDPRSARIVVWLTGLFSTLLLMHTSYLLTRSRSNTLLAGIFGLSTIAGLANQVLLTPDSGLVLFWTMGLWAAVLAFQGNRLGWILAGIAVGLGFYAKYLILFLIPVYFLALLWVGNNAIKKKDPWIGLLLAIVIALPHLIWNANHDWVTLKFQARHGLSIQGSSFVASSLPKAEEAREGSPEFQLEETLEESLTKETGVESLSTVKKRKAQLTGFKKSFQYVGDFLGGVAGLWGLYALLGLFLLIRSWRSDWWTREFKARLSPQVQGSSELKVVILSIVFPIGFLFLLSPFSKIEANWPAVHMPGLVLLFCVLLSEAQINKAFNWIAGISVIHLMLLIAVSQLGLAAKFFPNLRDNRLLQESLVYDGLVRAVTDRIGSDTVFAVDTYQSLSAIRLKNPQLMAVQWPGITRPSEYTRGHPDDLSLESKILQQDYFFIVSKEFVPSVVADYKAVSHYGVRVCSDGSIMYYSLDGIRNRCSVGVKDFRITKYVHEKSTSN
jgi:4-amino-4-deoxy-L-arabinose transferase-like glycosyltransferase